MRIEQEISSTEGTLTTIGDNFVSLTVNGQETDPYWPEVDQTYMISPDKDTLEYGEYLRSLLDQKVRATVVARVLGRSIITQPVLVSIIPL